MTELYPAGITKTGKVVTINAGLAGQGGEIAFGFASFGATLDAFPSTRIDRPK